MSTVLSLLVVKMWPYFGIYACILYSLFIKRSYTSIREFVLKLFIIFVGGLISAIWLTGVYAKRRWRP